jgi:predicted Rossmann fold nucleotide-binding protein DprA/Smf involved in DNA uptake
MSANTLSLETQATLLLCSPLRAGRNKDVQPLSIGDFNGLENHLRRTGAGLEQLFQADAVELVRQISATVATDRVMALLGRGFMLSMAIEAWQSAGIWVASRGEANYPERLHRLKQNAPPLIYGCGDPSLLAKGGLAIVGSRDVDAAGEEFTRKIAEKAAREGLQIVSGGARGVDQFAMLAALDSGGTAVGVLADSLLRSATSGKAREGIQDARLTLISPFDPEAGFNVGNAMQRNKYIYALADFGLVISSGYNEGGTWSGAIEQLEKLRLIPIFVRDGDVPEGNHQLLRRGAAALPREMWPAPLRETLEAASPKRAQSMETRDMFASELNETAPSYFDKGREEASVSPRKKRS